MAVYETAIPAEPEPTQTFCVILKGRVIKMREKISFDKKWMFHKGDIRTVLPTPKVIVYNEAKTERALRGPASRNYNTSSTASEHWESVDLPHDYVINEVPTLEGNEGLGFYPYNNAWYIKKFRITNEDKNKRLTLFFEGVATHATVYVNGCLMKHNYCGYTEFEVDITDVVDYGEENSVSVYVSTEEHEGWWYEGGGIYRHVWLIKTEPVSVDLYGVYVNPQRISDNLWSVPAEITLRNDYFENKRVRILCEIQNSMGMTVADGTCGGMIADREKHVFKLKISVESPLLWSPDSPHLYSLRTHVFVGKQEVDVYDIKFGFRTVFADPQKGLFINGKHFKIQGVCGHADCGLMGKAVPDNIHRYKVRLMQEMGANGYRTTHYPQSEVLMDALDENGFIVMNEVRWFESSEEARIQLETLVKRDRNRPSVMFWSIGNEEYFHVNDKGRRIAKSLYSLIRKLDNTRYIMTAISVSPSLATVCDDLDAIGINYNWDAYDVLHEKYPDKPILSSENCATGTTRGWYFDDNPDKAFIRAYDHDTNALFRSREYTWKYICDREWMMGGYQWIAFEHRGEAAWPRLCSQSGAIDLFLQKKDAFWQNQSHWTSDPMVHLLPHWNWRGLEGETIRVFAYTNTERLELFLNGRSLGFCNIEQYGHGEWEVEYEAGRLEVVAYKGDRIVAKDVRITSKEARSLVLKLDTENVKANGEDIAIFTCYAVDEDGNEVYDAAPTVTFSANSLGRIYSTGSDVTDHTSLFLPTRRMRAGRISVAVKLGVTSGELKLYAESFGLQTGVITVHI